MTRLHEYLQAVHRMRKEMRAVRTELQAIHNHLVALDHQQREVLDTVRSIHRNTTELRFQRSGALGLQERRLPPLTEDEWRAKQ
jgi:hypothetical protein